MCYVAEKSGAGSPTCSARAEDDTAKRSASRRDMISELRGRRGRKERRAVGILHTLAGSASADRGVKILPGPGPGPPKRPHNMPYNTQPSDQPSEATGQHRTHGQTDAHHDSPEGQQGQYVEQKARERDKDRETHMPRIIRYEAHLATPSQHISDSPPYASTSPPLQPATLHDSPPMRPTPPSRPPTSWAEGRQRRRQTGNRNAG